MTTTISLATRDCIVLGSDSLATSAVPTIDPFKLADHFFEKSGALKCESDGSPLLKNAAQLSAFVSRTPKDQLPNVTKLFYLKPYPIGVTFSGASIIGEYSIKNLVDAFLDYASGKIDAAGVSVAVVAREFFQYVERIYSTAYSTLPDNLKPHSEVLLSGYSADSLLPEVFRLTFADKCEIKQEVERGKFNILYSGQYDVIERVVDGVDLRSYIRLNERCSRVLSNYKTRMEEHLLATAKIAITLPDPDPTDEGLRLFSENFGGVRGLKANIESLSEQAAINFVEFLIDTMIKAQQFSGSIPTVGGDIHIGIITKANGFCWISKEEYNFRGHAVKKHTT